MLPNFDADWLMTLNKHIGALERSFLEELQPDTFDPADILGNRSQTFYTIQGLANFWSAYSDVDFWQYVNDTVVAAHGQPKIDLMLVLTGSPERVSLHLSFGSPIMTRTLLEGVFPHIRLDLTPAAELAFRLGKHFRYQGLLTGIPSRKGQQQSTPQQQDHQPTQSNQENMPPSRPDMQGLSQLERVIRGMHGATWAYVVQAHPRPRHKVAQVRLQTVDLLAQVTSQTRVQWQATQQGSRQITSVETGSQTQTFSGEIVNYRAQYLTRLLEHEIERLDRSYAAGQWTVKVYFGSSSFDNAERLASLLSGTLAGKDSRPDPLRATLCRESGASLSAFETYLSSDEVATLVQLPREEVPGYAIHDYVRFDVDFRPPPGAQLALGHIQQNGHDINDNYTISLDSLAKHCVVVGVTGSGKTTTVMNMLDRMVNAQKSFLVIEPAKTEYRALRSAFKDRADLRIYTLGNETTAPFRLNPFEFETDDIPGSSSVLTHIDFLKAVFNAAFVLYSPMPHVLETALHEVYEDKGWDVASGLNTRIPDWKERHRYPIFPTLTDLYHKIEIVTNRLRYHHEVESNVKAGLKARVGSLRIGSKGLMLDTPHGIPMRQLLSFPTILEMEGIGSDEEKTFLMGLFLARLYEYRRLQAANGSLPAGLQHLIIIEEAHRLLQNTSTQVDSESSNQRAQAVEVFTNMLSEVRAYGQGVLVAEQIPSKLAPDVLKNTNLKIVHRLIAQDDRQSIGQTMNLNTDQITHLGILPPGMAAVYAEGADHAYLVRLEDYKRNITPLQESQLKQLSPTYASVKRFQAVLDFEDYDLPLSPFGGPDWAIYQAAGKVLDTERSRWLWANILLRTAFSPAKLLPMLIRVSEYVEAELPYLPPKEHDRVARMVIVRGCAEILSERGAHYGWTYPQIEDLRVALTHGLVALARSYYLARLDIRHTRWTQEDIKARIQVDIAQASKKLDLFARKYEALLVRKQGPFAGCTHCRAKCLYRVDVATLLSKKDQARVDNELTSGNYSSATERYTRVAQVVTSFADRWMGEAQKHSADIGYCAALHVVASADFTEYEQALVGDFLQPCLLQEEE